MQPSKQQTRAPGSFAPLQSPSTNQSPRTPAQQHHQQQQSNRPPPPRKVSSSGSESSVVPFSPPIITNMPRQRNPDGPSTPVFQQQQFAMHPNSSNASLLSQSSTQNFSRPQQQQQQQRVPTGGSTTSTLRSGHARKHSATQGHFEPTLPSTNTSSLARSHRNQEASGSQTSLSASQIAAQAAVMSHTNSQERIQQQQLQQQLQQQQQHNRHRSQTVPVPGEGNDGSRRGSGARGPVSPPTLNLIEASAPRDSGFSNGSHALQGAFSASFRDQDRLGGMPSSAATAAANVVFPRSGRTSPNVPLPASISPVPSQMAPPPVPPASEKVSKSEKAKAKLFSRSGKINTKGLDPKDKPLPSPGKIGHALSALQRANFSTNSLVEPSSSASMYSMNNSSSATIRPVDTADERGREKDKEKDKEKEKKHHFLSRQRHKLKDDFHLPLSSTASNSRPTNPNAPTSLYNFNVPASPAPTSSTFSKTKKDKKHLDRSESRLDGDLPSLPGGATSVASLSQQSTLQEPVDSGKLGLHSMSLDDAWPLLKAKLLVVFEGEEIITPIEDWNRVVQMHIQYCVQRRSPNMMLDDLRDLLEAGFKSLDRTLKATSEERFIPTLVELWVFTFTSILPFLQIVFLPLDQEVSGYGTILAHDKARDFWGGVFASSSSSQPAHLVPASNVLDVRRLVLTAYRDVVILPRYDTLKPIFSRLSLDHFPSPLATSALGSAPVDITGYSASPPEYFPAMPVNLNRPGTAMSLDPSNASYNSTSTTLLGENSTASSAGGRSRAISNVSFGSHGSEGAAGSGLRPFTPSVLGSVREQNAEDSKQVTDMVGRMFQCMSVLSSLGGNMGPKDEEGFKKMTELCKMLKLNWLGRGRTGRNRRGMVGGRVRREETTVS